MVTQGEDDSNLGKPVKLFNFCSGEAILSEKTQVLLEGPVKKFVALLRDGEKQLAASSSSVEFLKIETWFQWLHASIGAASLSITDAGGVLGFEIGLKPSTTSPIFRFASAGFSAALGLAPPLNAPIAASGLPGNGEILILGLDPPSGSTNLKMTLPEVFSFAGLPNLANVLPFLDKIKLSLGGPTHRNAIWFEPKSSYKTVIRLQFTVPTDDIHHFFTKRLLNKTKDPPKEIKVPPNTLELTAAYVVVKKTLREMRWQTDGSRFSIEANVTLVAKCEIHLPKDALIKFSVALTFNACSFDFNLVPEPESFDNVLVWLAAIVEIDFVTQLDILKNALDIEKIDFTHISLTFTTGQLKPIYLRLELKVVHQKAVFLFSYRWSGGSGKLKAELWPRSWMSALHADEQKLNSNWEEYLVFNDSQPVDLVLANFFKADNNPLTASPQELGGHMSHLILEVGGGEIALYGRLNLQKVESGLSLDSITFSGAYRWTAPKHFNISFTVSCSLKGVHDKTGAYMTGTVVRNKNVWTLSTSIENLSVSALEEFLGGPSSKEIMEFIGKLRIVTLDITYTFPSNFFSKGILRLGDLELDLEFTHETNTCKFEAKLRPTSKESTIGTVLHSITGYAIDLPSFITDVRIGGDDLVRVEFSKNAARLLFVATIRIGLLKFSYLQHHRDGSTVTKRVVKVSVQLPSLTIPMIDHPIQLFGELIYLWVYAPASGDSPAGFTAKEVKHINAELSDPHDHLVFKKTTDNEDVSVIAEGSHFVLIGEETRTVTIDYVFQKSAKYNESNTPAGGKTGALKEKQRPLKGSKDPAGTAAEETPEDPAETHMTVYKKSIGPLSVSNIGFQYKDGVLGIHLDAELLLGPIGFTLLGLRVELKLVGGLNFQKIDIKDLVVSLDGLSVSFDKEPMQIAGTFNQTDTPGEEKSYEGGLVVGFDPYRFTAAGMYKKADEEQTFKSLFVFGKLEGPLIQLGYVEISGITGGFGYNIELKLPSAAEVPEFPFVKDVFKSDNPSDALGVMIGGNFFKPSEGSFWVAAGLKVTAFQALTIDAVVVVQWNPYITLAMIGIAVLDVPKVRSKKMPKFLHLELGISTTVDFRSGVLRCEGQLTQNSHILHPDCQVTGGFAIYYWFPAADEALAHPELEGDWVVTVGGYHPAFKPPAYYPKPPPRLGISWKVSNNINITGEAYFAITPKVCMAGISLAATFSAGPISAYFNAHADFLINFDPFYFTVDIGVTVGVKYNIDTWLISTHIGAEISAQLYLQGPPFSGRLDVDFRIYSFSINFGPDSSPPEKASLVGFYQLVVQSTEKVEAGPDKENYHQHVLGCQSGLFSNKPSPPPAETPKNWIVHGGDFSFRIACRFPINSASIKSGSASIESSTNPSEIYAKPMELVEPLSSTMEITIKHFDRLGQLDQRPLLWKVAEVVKKVPRALWGIYDPKDDPRQHKNPPESLLDSSDVAIPLIMGVIISAPDPVTPKEAIGPFKPALQKPINAFEEGTYKYFPTRRPASTCWHPAEPLMEPQGERAVAEGQWSKVAEIWGKDLKQQDTVEAWSKAFCWKPKLTAKAPEKLMAQFGSLYMAAPMLTVDCGLVRKSRACSV